MNTPYPLPTDKPLSAAEVKRKFMAAGKPVAAWADANGYSRRYVYMVLNGQYKGHFGKAHDIAVALGLKLAPGIQLAA